MKRWFLYLLAGASLLGLASQLPGCAAGGGAGGKSAAERVYVKPGEHDAYYAFISGGHHGNIYVYGMPSCRHITTIPVFTPEPAVGYGVDEETREMLGGRTWGDAHHPGLSETDGNYDGLNPANVSATNTDNDNTNININIVTVTTIITNITTTSNTSTGTGINTTIIIIVVIDIVVLSDTTNNISNNTANTTITNPIITITNPTVSTTATTSCFAYR